jgi:hypothetical protein
MWFAVNHHNIQHPEPAAQADLGTISPIDHVTGTDSTPLKIGKTLLHLTSAFAGMKFGNPTSWADWLR